ncbi:MAG: prolipoprotein diacylglyceryl transferase [Proteobacteria bacterium]|nr:prolipoprotein diacylglyceryl transferase [Pseudomonadota bacterium]NCA28693.1 prolipoprotein diacylglyceryl transferase [Pseudomonadota bacterium]
MIINVPEIDPVALSFSFIKIRWYSLAYIFGIIFTFLFIKYHNKKTQILTPKALDDWMVYAILSIILGGRLGYIIFYNPAYFIKNPLEILAFWHGGMSFHGGLLGASVGMWFFTKKYQIDFWKMCDVLGVSAPFGLMCGRIANFINLELYGRPTSGNFGFIFPNSDGIPRHPSQLYEACLEGFLLLLVMTFCYFKTNYVNYPKKLTGIFLTGYGISRFIVEYFREPDSQIGLFFNLISMGQILSLPIIFLGYWLILTSSNKHGIIFK